MEEEKDKSITNPLQDVISDKEFAELANLYADCVTEAFERIVDGVFMHNVWFGLIIMELFILRTGHFLGKYMVAFVVAGFIIQIICNLIRCAELKKHFFVSAKELTKNMIEIAKKCTPIKKQYIFMTLCAINTAIIISSIYLIVKGQFNGIVLLFAVFLPYIVRRYGMSIVKKILHEDK